MSNLFKELSRRKVFRVAGVYAVVGWVLAQVAATLESALTLPGWFDALVVSLLLIGFPLAIILAWAFEVTPDGVKLTVNEDDSGGHTTVHDRRVDYALLVALLLVVGLVVWQQSTKPVDVTAAEAASTFAPAGLATNTTATGNSSKAINAASIAVLPFADLSPNKDQEYFCDGISEEILNVLVRIDALKVASRTSAFAYKHSQLRIPAIAEELGVRHIVEGSVRRAGEAIRITAQLIDAETDEQLWSDTFDRKLTAENVFAIQDEIATAIVDALSVRMDLPSLTDRVVVAADTDDLETLELYYEANALFLARGTANLTRAMELFEEVTTRDPDFARGWSGLSMVYAVGDGWGLPARDYDKLTREAVARAIALNPNLSSPYAALSQNIQAGSDPDWIAALENLDKALSIDPRDPNIYNWRGLLWERTGFVNRALADYDTCLEIDPAYINCGYNKSDVLSVLGRVEETATLDMQLMRRGAVLQLWSPVRLRRMVEADDRYGALLALNMMGQMIFPDQPWIVDELYQAYFNRSVDRRSEFEPLMQRLAAAGYREFDTTAYDVIASAFRRYEAVKFVGAWVHTVYYLEDLTREQRRQLIIRAGVPKFWHAHGFPPQCKPVGTVDFECS